MSVYREPAAVFRRAPRASWWRRNVVAWWHGTRRRLLLRDALRSGRAVLINRRFLPSLVGPGTHSAGPG